MRKRFDMRQQYDQYTAEDHRVWQILFERQMALLPGKAEAAFLKGVELVGFVPERIPRFEEVNERLRALTGWEITVVPGLIDDDLFFDMLTQRQFPCSTWLRSMAQLDYLEEPDMFHDVFAHVPLLSDPDYCNFLVGLGHIALDHIEDAYAIELLSRIYWFTVEFGLINTGQGVEIYGAGILSSQGEVPYSLSGKVPQHPFDVEHIMRQSYIKSEFQKQYFVITGYDQLYQSLPNVAHVLEKLLATAS